MPRPSVYKRFIGTYILLSLGYIPRGGIAGSWGQDPMFNYLRDGQAIFQNGFTLLYSHQQWMKAPVSPHPRRPSLLSVLFITGILEGAKWRNVVIRLYFTWRLMVSSIFVYLLQRNYLSRPLVHV